MKGLNLGKYGLGMESRPENRIGYRSCERFWSAMLNPAPKVSGFPAVLPFSELSRLRVP